MSHRITRRIIVLLLSVLSVSVIVHAAEDSRLQMMLVTSPRFQSRVQYLAWDEAATILAEAPGTACHAERMALAQEILGGQGGVQRVALGIVRSNAGGRVILDTVVDGNGVALTNNTTEADLNAADKSKIDTSATDAALASAITNYWNTIAKCYTGV